MTDSLVTLKIRPPKNLLQNASADTLMPKYIILDQSRKKDFRILVCLFIIINSLANYPLHRELGILSILTLCDQLILLISNSVTVIY